MFYFLLNHWSAAIDINFETYTINPENESGAIRNGGSIAEKGKKTTNNSSFILKLFKKIQVASSLEILTLQDEYKSLCEAQAKFQEERAMILEEQAMLERQLAEMQEKNAKL